MADVNRGRSTAREMVDTARAEGFAASPRLLRDWVQRGLLAPPNRVSLGRARGSSATWPYDQARLFVSFLGHHRPGTRLTPLYNLPVWIWLRFGEEYVPTIQLRRALTSWGRDVTHEPFGPAERSAARVARRLSRKNSKRAVRKRLRQLLADLAAGEPVGRLDLLSAARDVMDPEGLGLARGPLGAQLTPEAYIDLVYARLAAISAVRSMGGSEFEEVRRLYAAARAGYAAAQPGYARDPDLGSLYESPTIETEINSACADLVTVIGLWRQHAPK